MLLKSKQKWLSKPETLAKLRTQLHWTIFRLFKEANWDQGRRIQKKANKMNKKLLNTPRKMDIVHN